MSDQDSEGTPKRKRRVPKWKLEEDFRRMMASANFESQPSGTPTPAPLAPRTTVASKAAPEGLPLESLSGRVMGLCFGLMFGLVFLAVIMPATVALGLMYLGLPFIWRHVIGRYYPWDNLVNVGFYGFYGTVTAILIFVS